MKILDQFKAAATEQPVPPTAFYITEMDIEQVASELLLTLPESTVYEGQALHTKNMPDLIRKNRFTVVGIPIRVAQMQVPA